MSAIPVDTWAGSQSVDDLAHHLAALRRRKREIELEISEVEAAIVGVLGGERQTTVDGVGTLVVHPGRRRQAWDHDSLYDRLATEAKACHCRRVDESTGEIESDSEHVLRHVRACVGKSAWKVGGLRELLIDPDEYSTSVYGPPSVEIVQAGKS